MKTKLLRFYLLPAVLLTALLVSALLAGCTKSAPPCDNIETVDAVINAVSENLKKDFKSLTSFQPGMELSDDEWRLMRSGMIITVKNMTQLSYDEGTGQYECAGDVTINGVSGTEAIPVTYTSRLLESGELEVTVSGLD
ncbi:MAG TPA: hypothetical protein ENG95_01465 [Nitrospirae bacterium]|nr:hypothetical protein BMS3Abin10_00140 [bacterium BMS3Abin10]GBE39325.1 hypothetical protein BMS3Bbin08_01947 [bacterium BMS3Bbin08]HDK81424.1 hypothetical protein [Nitrospirota bacterium]HDO25297.1 hypothetical protein [Nitrospirota bacterium]